MNRDRAAWPISAVCRAGIKFLRLSLACTFLLVGCESAEGPDQRITETGLHTLQSSGESREYYVQMPTGASQAPPALLIALHGAGDSYAGWLEGGFQGAGLLEWADEALVVVPNARVKAAGRRIWDPGTETDYIFFLDLLAELQEKIGYDPRRVFVTGHSAGALMTHELGCRYGDIIRGIAPSAGSITSSVAPRCTGSVAVLQMQSEVDEIVPPAAVMGTRDLWVLYNGFDINKSVPGIADDCADYSLGSHDYPVQWCLHRSPEFDGHAWWSGADAAVWGFFEGLNVLEPADTAPPGGGNKQLQSTLPLTMTLTVEFPAGMPAVLRAGLFLYPPGSQLPISGAPVQILNADVDLGMPQAGTRQTFEVPVRLPPSEALPATYTLMLAVYVEGGSMPIPTPGVDLNVIHELTIDSAAEPVVVPAALILKPI